MKTPNPRSLIRKLGLQPHPEGGYFREVYRSAETVQTERGPRAALTTIHYLLLRGERSLLHRVLSDEVWHHSAGAPLKLISVSPNLKQVEQYRLGPLGRSTQQVVVIPRLHWQAAEPLGDFALLGCTVGPGFDFSDFTMLRDDKRALARLHEAQPKLKRFFGA